MEQQKTNSKTLTFLILIMILALGLRSLVFTKQINNMNLMNDPKNYWIMSHQLVDEGIYGYAYYNPSSEPNARVTPGYPLFLAAVYKILRDKYLQITAVRLLQVIISSISIFLGFLFVKKAFKKDSMALLTAFFIAIYPTYVLSPVLLLTETLALFTMLLYFCLSLYAFESRKMVINLLTGAAFGLHVLVRPALLPMFVFPFIFYLLPVRWTRRESQERDSSFTSGGAEPRQNNNAGLSRSAQKKRSRGLIVLFAFQLLGLVLIMSPWWIRNIIVFNKLIITAEASGNPFLAGTYPYFQNYFKDTTAEICSSSANQLSHGIKRIAEGLKSKTLLYIRWFTVGKTAYMFKEPYLSRLLINSRGPSMVIHFSILIFGVLGIIIHAIKDHKFFWFYLYGLIILGIQLMFVPDARFAYLIMFFLIVGAAQFISISCRSLQCFRGAKQRGKR